MRTVGKIFGFLAIVGVGAAGMFALAMQKEIPTRKSAGVKAKLVSVVAAAEVSQNAVVTSMGTVIPSRSVQVVPQVGGRVVKQDERLVPGGRFAKGEVLLRVDPRDYDLALSQALSQVSRAEVDLATERGRKTVAEQEWDFIKDRVQPTEEGRALALRELQLETAQAVVEGARSTLSRADLARRRTVIKAPFNALVIEESVDVGQVVGPGTRIAALVDTDAFWVRTLIPVDRLTWIRLPRGDDEGSPARIVQKIGVGDTAVRRGFVARLLGDVDPIGKMARVVVEVPRPLEPTVDGNDIPLLLGSNVTVEIEGPPIEGVVSIPRRALRDDDRVWIERGEKLHIVPVEVVWTREDDVFVNGLDAGGHVITSRISAPVEGMALRTGDVDKAPARAGEEPPSASNGTHAGAGDAGAR